MNNVKYTKVDKKSQLVRYQKRVPSELQQYIPIVGVKRNLGTVEDGGIDKAVAINNAFEEALNIAKLNSLTDEQKTTTIHKIMSVVVPSKRKPTEALNVSAGSVKAISDEYLTTLNIQPNTLQSYTSMLETFIAVVGADIPLNEVVHKDLDKYKGVVLKLPSRLKKKYKSMEVSSIIKLKVPIEDRLSSKSQNEYIKTVKALFQFGENRGYINNNIARSMKGVKQTTIAREQKRALTIEEVTTLLYAAKQYNINFYKVLKILAYTGMRSSELTKGELIEVDGVLCYSLLTPKERLKTHSSIRLIPLNNNLNREDFNIPMLEKILKSLSHKGKKFLDKVLVDTEKVSVYSLRHSFGTNIINNNSNKRVPVEVVSRLMGHVNSSLTLTRYADFSVGILKEVIDTLDYENAL